MIEQIKPIKDKRIKDITGQRFGKLVVIGYVGSEKRQSKWLCQCDCGNEYVGTKDHLMSGNTRSCGCMSGYLHHGMYGTRLYRIFLAMKQRCYNPNNTAYKHYGGRGIKVCSQWMCNDGFLLFMRWSMENGYDDSLSIDRIDVNGDYSPENCRWSNRSVQGFNKAGTKNPVGIRGVTFERERNVYYARICVNYKQINLGRYKNLDDAISARRAAEQKYFNQTLC